MKPSHRILGALLVGGAATVTVTLLQGCKKGSADAPKDPCEAYEKARNKLLDRSVKRFNKHERRIDEFLDAMKVADYLDESLKQRGCKVSTPPGESGGSGGSGGGGGGAKNLATVNPMHAAQNAIEGKIKAFAKGEREKEACILGQSLCSAVPRVEVLTDALKAMVSSDIKTIHGRDNRRGWARLDDNQRRIARGTVALFMDGGWTEQSGQWQTEPVQSLGATLQLCANQPFVDEPSGSYCSGFVVAPEWVVTARHCLEGKTVEKIRVVTGYHETPSWRERTEPLSFPTASVYKVVDATRRSEDGEDWALLRLDRPVAGDVVSLAVDTAEVVPGTDRQLAVSGHPLGLPIKYADEARVIDVGRQNASKLLFWATLDTFGGNSGSPIVDVGSGKVVGVLVRGDPDFVPGSDARCLVEKKCLKPGDCKGEVVQRVTTEAFTAALTSIGPAPSPGASPEAGPPPTTPAPAKSNKPKPPKAK
ncbi:MAG: trypsin-like peptidase domain-containing protein [Myxococcales bacterium]|nr:trypsin-like peptidase domain-containing protein [Myxococcales bacterium]